MHHSAGICCWMEILDQAHSSGEETVGIPQTQNVVKAVKFPLCEVTRLISQASMADG